MQSAKRKEQEEVGSCQFAVSRYQSDPSCFWLTDFIQYLVYMLINQFVN